MVTSFHPIRAYLFQEGLVRNPDRNPIRWRPANLDDMARLAPCKLHFSAARFVLLCAAIAIVAQGKWVRTALTLEPGGVLFAGALCD